MAKGIDPKPAERLKRLRLDAGFTSARAASKRYRWPHSTYASHENGSRGISEDDAKKYGKAFQSDYLWIMHGLADRGRVVVPVEETFPPDPDPDTEPRNDRPDRNRLVHVPDLNIFGALGSGGLLSVLADANSGQIIDPEQLRGYWTFPEYLVRSFSSLRGVYAWEVRGDSMEPTLPGGSVVFVDVSQNTLPPDDIYALDYGDGLIVKRVKLVPRTPRLRVISDNSRYAEDELERNEVVVYGRVVGWFQWRK